MFDKEKRYKRVKVTSLSRSIMLFSRMQNFFHLFCVLLSGEEKLCKARILTNVGYVVPVLYAI